MRQIAGAMAKRIVSYALSEDRPVRISTPVLSNSGSRVDLFLPLGTQIEVKLGQKRPVLRR